MGEIKVCRLPIHIHYLENLPGEKIYVLYHTVKQYFCLYNLKFYLSLCHF